MAGKFKVGDVVRLKSGGVDMTVTDVPDRFSGGSSVRCSWHAGEKPEHSNYPAAALELVHHQKAQQDERIAR